MSFAKEDKIGALWLRTSKNNVPFLSGKIGDQQVVVFKTRNKRERGPEYEVFKSTPREEQKPQKDEQEVPW